MSGIPQKDGDSGRTARVDLRGRSHVDALTLAMADAQNKFGNSYRSGEGLPIAVTVDGLSNSALFIKNQDDADLVITSLKLRVGPSTGGPGGVVVAEVRRNATKNTLSGEPALVPRNMNFGSGNTPSSDSEFFQGEDGVALDDGTIIQSVEGTDDQEFVLDAGYRIPKGQSIGVNIVTPSGNTSIDVRPYFDFYLDKKDETQKAIN